MKTYLAWMVVLAGTLMAAGGCVGRLVGEGAEKTLGPKGAYWEETSVGSSKALVEYTNFELGKVANNYGRNVPREFIGLFEQEFHSALVASKLPMDPRGKTLVFNVAVIHYETADTTDNVLGPLEQVVARVELVDKSSGKVLATGNAIGRTGKSVGLGVDWKARGLAKALIKWVKNHRGEQTEQDSSEG